jgi:purine-binding chemotaxis protein CheW
VVTPVFDMRRRLGLTEGELELDDVFVLAWSGGRLVGLIADTVGDVLELSTEEIIEADAIAGHSAVIDGVLKLRDGLALVQDLDEFLSLDEKQRLEQALAPCELEPRPRANPAAC